MAFPTQQPHFLLFPFMAQGHTIPMIDIAKLLARRGVTVTILTTATNELRFKTIVARAVESGLRIRTIHLRFPTLEAGLPEGCENLDMLPSVDLFDKFFVATRMLQPQVEELLRETKPSPNCMISDMCFPWTTCLAQKFGIPRIVFHGMCCFSLLCWNNLAITTLCDDETATSDSENVQITGMPDRIELTRAQVKALINPSLPDWQEINSQMREAEREAYGVVVNSFEELEPEYLEAYRKAKGINVWCIGPVLLCNEDELDKAERGNRAATGEHQVLTWLDSLQPNSVIYICLGSISRLSTPQMIELGLGLESSNRPFLWVVRDKEDDFNKWLADEKFEKRVEGRGVLIHGWAPQVLILSHLSVGGFLTHCGWNSSLEAMCAGVPVITWPFFAEQFYNEKLLVNVLEIGVRSGIEVPVFMGEEEKVGIQVNRNEIGVAVEKLMGEGEEAEMRRKKAKDVGEMARKAMENEGSSHLHLTKLIQDIMEQ